MKRLLTKEYVDHEYKVYLLNHRSKEWYRKVLHGDVSAEAGEGFIKELIDDAMLLGKAEPPVREIMSIDGEGAYRKKGGGYLRKADDGEALPQ